MLRKWFSKYTRPVFLYKDAGGQHWTPLYPTNALKDNKHFQKLHQNCFGVWIKDPEFLYTGEPWKLDRVD